MEFTTLLTELFEKVEGDFEKHLISSYRSLAERQHASWLKRLDGDEPHFTAFASRQTPVYVKWLESRNSNCLFHEPHNWTIKGAHKHQYEIDYDLAETEARMQVRLSKRQFVAKQSKKLYNACGDRQVKVEGELILSAGIVTGTLYVASGSDNFRVEMSMKQNISCLHNPFWQFPARFTAILLDGKSHKSRSEKWMKENFATNS